MHGICITSCLAMTMNMKDQIFEMLVANNLIVTLQLSIHVNLFFIVWGKINKESETKESQWKFA